MAKVGIPKLEAKSFSGWAFVLVAGVAAGRDGDLRPRRVSTAPPARLRRRLHRLPAAVTTDQLNVRAGPSQDAELLRTLSRGDGSTGPGSRPTSTASWRTAPGR